MTGQQTSSATHSPPICSESNDCPTSLGGFDPIGSLLPSLSLLLSVCLTDFASLHGVKARSKRLFANAACFVNRYCLDAYVCLGKKMKLKCQGLRCVRGSTVCTDVNVVMVMLLLPFRTKTQQYRYLFCVRAYRRTIIRSVSRTFSPFVSASRS